MQHINNKALMATFFRDRLGLAKTTEKYWRT